LVKSEQLPATSYQLPAASFQLPATSFQRPATSFQVARMRWFGAKTQVEKWMIFGGNWGRANALI
jgi:hypothetical protein